MIIIALQGGIGNQLFQYAFGRQLSILNNTELVLDLSKFSHHNQRTYQLNLFPIASRVAKRDDMKRVVNKKNLLSFYLKKGIIALKKQTPIQTINETSFCYDKDIHSAPDNSYLIGYWQSERYFSQISNIIRSDLSFQSPLTQQNYDYANQMKKFCSVAIHIRRGDYLLNPIAYSTHGICSTTYYSLAMQYIERFEKNPEYFVFSDDILWAKENIKASQPITFIDWNSDSPYEDLHLMALCKHHIIANSSFSWWGAWLGKKEGQIVIAPEPWFDDPQHDTSSLYLPGWIRILKNDNL